MTEDFEPDNSGRLDSRSKEAEQLDDLLRAWQVERPPLHLGQRLLDSYHSRRGFSPALLGRTVRIPLWAVALGLVLLLAMLPFAVRGLTAPGVEGSAPSSRSRPALARGGTEFGSFSPGGSAATGNYVTVVDLSTLQPTTDINLKIFRAEENNQ